METLWGQKMVTHKKTKKITVVTEQRSVIYIVKCIYCKNCQKNWKKHLDT